MINSNRSRKKKVYDENRIDISYLDKKIKSEIENEKKLLPKYKKDLCQKETNIHKESKYRIRKIQESEIKELKNKISEIENNTILAEYVYLSNKIIDKYTSLNEIPVSVNFFNGSNSKKQKNEDPNENEKEKLLNEYIEIASNYTNIPITKKQKIDTIICNCGHTNIYKNSCLMKCEECGEEQLIQINQFSVEGNENIQQGEETVCTNYKDIDRVNLSQKYKYKRKVHFRDTVNQYQGKQNKRIDQKVYDDLEKEFINHKLVIENETCFHKRHSKLTKEHIQMFLSETNHNNHYEDLQLIHNYFTGIPCPDLSHIEESLYEDFDKVVEAFTKLENLDRLNFLNGSYILYQLLRRQNFKVSEYEFDFLKTRERKLIHDELFARICVELEWNMHQTC